MEKTLPVFRLTIDEDLESTQEINAVALVDVPAIGRDFFAFAETEQQFAVVNEDERFVVGPAMIPDKLIYRRDDDGFEYNVVFGKQDIEKMAVKFFAKNMQKNGNEMHNPDKPVDMVFYQSWIADESKGIPKMKQFENVPDGTWFLGAKVNDEESWSKVKDGTFRGFSVEGLFDMIPVRMSMTAEQRLSLIEELLKDIE